MVGFGGMNRIITNLRLYHGYFATCLHSFTPLSSDKYETRHDISMLPISLTTQHADNIPLSVYAETSTTQQQAQSLR